MSMVLEIYLYPIFDQRRKSLRKMDCGEGNGVLNKSFGAVAGQFLELSEDECEDKEQTVPDSKPSIDDVLLKTVTRCIDFALERLSRR